MHTAIVKALMMLFVQRSAPLQGKILDASRI